MSGYVEPEDGSIVGWGDPVEGIVIRDDDGMTGRGEPDETWRKVGEDYGDDPVGWAALLRLMGDAEPYLLEPKPLKRLDP